MMLALTAKEVRSLGKALTFRAVREQGALPHPGEVARRRRKGRRETEEEEGGRARGGKAGGGRRRGCMREIAVMMCMREGDSERQGERV